MQYAVCSMSLEKNQIMIDLNIPLDDDTSYLISDLNTEPILQENEIHEEVVLQSPPETNSHYGNCHYYIFFNFKLFDLHFLFFY